MYEEWMDAVPLIVSGCHEHNIAQWNRAKEYWERNGDMQRAKEIEALIDAEWKKLNCEGG